MQDHTPVKRHLENCRGQHVKRVCALHDGWFGDRSQPIDGIYVAEQPPHTAQDAPGDSRVTGQFQAQPAHPKRKRKKNRKIRGEARIAPILGRCN